MESLAARSGTNAALEFPCPPKSSRLLTAQLALLSTFGAQTFWPRCLFGQSGLKVSLILSSNFKRRRCFSWPGLKEWTASWPWPICRASMRCMWLLIVVMLYKKINLRNSSRKSWSSSKGERSLSSTTSRCSLSRQQARRSSSVDDPAWWQSSQMQDRDRFLLQKK